MLKKLAKDIAWFTAGDKRQDPATRAILAKDRGDWAVAGAAYQKALLSDPDNPELLAGLGLCLRAQDDRFGALQALRKAWELTTDPAIGQELTSLIGTTSDYRAVQRAMAEVFDRKYYLSMNTDVARAGIGPEDHYLLYGWKEARVPCRTFDPVYYEATFGRDLADGEMPLAHFATAGRNQGLRSNPINDRLWYEPALPTKEDWATVVPAVRTEATRAVVILPVYKGRQETLAAVYHALSARGNAAYSVLVINDCGPDEALNDDLSALAAQGLFDYRVNSTNRGFVKTVNAGIQRESGNLDVVLLNSDAFVFPGWFERLVAHADRDPRVATVTPLSNNATLCSYPVIDRDNAMALERSPAEIDRLAARVNAGLAVEAPTGVGFCFYMRRSVIDEIGALDEQAFKLGYGEENDFCMRALEAGYKNLIAGDVFVFHVGSVSFSAIKDANFNAGIAALVGKHPNFLELGRKHMASDPGRKGRRNLDLERLVDDFDDGVVFVTHRWHGGIDTYIGEQTAALQAKGVPYLLLRVHDRFRVTLETDPRRGLFVPNLSHLDLRTDADLVAAILKRLRAKLIHVNSLAGLDWGPERKMLDLIAGSGRPYVYVGHDYSAVSFNYQLIRPDGLYAGLPDLATLESWGAMALDGAGDLCDVRERIEVYGRFLSGAARVETPSKAAATILAGFFPTLSIEVAPHRIHLAPAERLRRRNKDGRLKIATLGAIGPHKGSDLLLAMARDARARELPLDFTIVGYSDKDQALTAEGVSITGRYKREAEAVRRLQGLQPDLFLIASVWPETFCYTLSFAVHLGIPPVAFDLGAQGERIGQLGWGTLLDPFLINRPRAVNDRLIDLDVDGLWRLRGDERQ